MFSLPMLNCGKSSIGESIPVRLSETRWALEAGCVFYGRGNEGCGRGNKKRGQSLKPTTFFFSCATLNVAGATKNVASINASKTLL